MLNWLFGGRMAALMSKEFSQIRRDRRLALSLIIPPTLQLVLFGFALNATVDNLRLGIADYDQTPESRDLIAAMTQSGAFHAAGSYASSDRLGDVISQGKLDAGIVLPNGFARDLHRGQQATVQIFLNAMNANTAAIAQGYSEGVIGSWNQSKLTSGELHARFTTLASAPPTRRGIVALHPAFLFNPGLVSTWFIVTGTFGVLLTLNGSLVASAAMVKEREAGTVEQLLMTPAGTGEIIVAKIAPLFVLLCGMVLFATALIKVIFQIPFRGNLLMVLGGAALCVLCGIAIGTFLATFTRTAQQAQLMSFFVNPPLSSLSGALTPVEAMPHWMQPLTLVNPIRHFGVITRAALLKGSGIDILWPNILALIAITAVLLALSVWRFRKQLG
ncbi:MAG TPA: ABC transporter permease [Bryobacteraceae bacterium]|nr:ABC transporter permease [Bryobacteraceae bacterium]